MKCKKITSILFSSLLTCSLISTCGLQVFAEESNNQPPSGDNNDGGTPPEKPEGDSSGNDGGTSPDMPDGEAPGEGGGMNSEGMGGGADTQSFDYSGTYTGALNADGEEISSSSEEISATDTDQNAAVAQNGGTLTIDSDTLNKSGDDTNGDNCNFYGLNSIAVAVGEGSLLKITNSILSATSEGSNAIFATDNATAYANGVTINTTQGNSRGLDATYGGTIIANDVTISTQGEHSASVATDRGGGNVSVTNSTLSTAGSGSPLLYSTGDIEVDNVSGTASGAQIAGMEGLNTILIYNSELSSTNSGITGSDPIANGIIIYQSTSGDADTSTGEAARFEAVNSILSSTIDSGAMFYVTNTTANIVLSGTILSFDSANVNLLQVEGNDSNSWGSAGSNGGTVNFTCIGETVSGNISVDTISSAGIYLLDGTTYTGSTSVTTNAAASTSETPITMNISSDSKWIVTGDSTVTNLNIEDGGSVVDSEGNTVTIIANGETVVSGTSEYTVTVTGSYGTSFETSEANILTTSYIDRSDFDTTYGLSTTFNTNGTSADTSTTAEAQATTVSAVSTKTAEDDNSMIFVAAGVGAIVLVSLIAFFITKKKA